MHSVTGAARNAPGSQPVRQDVPSDGLLTTILAALDDAKAEDVVTIDLTDKSSIADIMIVASGRSERHVSSVADRVVRTLKESGYGRAAVEGQDSGDWILIDAGHVIVHVFRPEVRAFYRLEKMWSDDMPRDRTAI